MIATGDLDHRAVFQRPVQGRDEDGQIVQGWQDVLTEKAAVLYLRGTESVMQARMQSRSPAILTVRGSSLARQITSEWRVVVRDRGGAERLFEIKEDPRPIERGAFLEMLVESGR